MKEIEVRHEDCRAKIEFLRENENYAKVWCNIKLCCDCSILSI